MPAPKKEVLPYKEAPPQAAGIRNGQRKNKSSDYSRGTARRRVKPRGRRTYSRGLVLQVIPLRTA
eukprot:IDg1313t1